MLFNIERSKLVANIQYLINIIPTKNINPTLLNFLIEADEEKQQIKFTATDMEVTVLVVIQTNVVEPGKAAVSARNLLEIVNSLEDKPINFHVEEGYLKLHCGHADFSLLCADHAKFPLMPDIDFQQALSVSAPIFAKMINIAGIAVSPESTRPIFTGILWRLTPNHQIIAATDGKKIAETRKSHRLDITETLEQVILPKGLNYLEKVIDPATPEIRFMFEASRVFFSYKNYTLMSNTVSGRFPAYGKVLQTKNPYSLIINKDLLRQIVRRVALLSTEDFYRIKFDIQQSKMIISCVNDEMGDATDEITEFEFDGPDFSIAFNYKYILSAINVMETEKMKFTFAEPVNGIVNDKVLIYHHPELEDYQATILLMPLRLK